MRCSVQFCTNDTKRTTKNHGITFHLFPKDSELRTAWIEALGMAEWEPKERSTICSEHFRNEDFYQTKCGLRKIRNGAIPVVNDNSEDLDAPATLRVCRICLAMNMKMYNIREHKLDQALEQITGIQTNNEDKLPQKLCWECAHRLKNYWRFNKKVQSSHTLLMNMLCNKQYITIRDIKSTNRTHNKLKTTLDCKYIEPNFCNINIQDDQVIVKNEIEDVNGEEEMKEIGEETTDIPPITEVEVKDESPENDTFFFEYADDFNESEDEKKLSEVSVNIKKKEKEKKKSKVKKKARIGTKKEAYDNPLTTVDKYKTTYVKRRKTMDGLDESLFTISKLSYDEQVAEIQKRQDSVNYKNAPYKCNICYRGFLIKDRYDAHSIRHSDQSGEYECFICKTRMKTGRALRKHLTAQHTEKFSCNGCPFVTRNRGVAREHEKWHAGTKYQCPHCPSEFDKLTTYMGHIRIKHVSDFVCELCGFTFISKKGIDVHKKKKHRLADKNVPLEGPYCDVCEVRFVSDEAHSRHLNLSSRHSSDSDPNRIRNDSQSMNSERSCGRMTRKVERRPIIHPRDPSERDRRHIGGPITCEQCGAQLRDMRMYAQHFRRAHPDKNRTKYPAMKTPCMCEQCGRLFQSMALLKDHMWVHTGEKRFKCDRCDKSFTQKNNLVFHTRLHNGDRPTFECPLCGKHFAFFNNLRRHMFIHTGQKPHKCDTCGKCFTTAGEQRAHVEHVHLKKPWPRRVRSQRQIPPHPPLWKRHEPLGV